MRPRTAIAVLAKAPIEGFAKTRLVPALGPKGAADLQRAMILRTVDTAIGSGLGPVSLWCAPDRSHRLFRDIAATRPVDLSDQSGADLGRRMQAAFERLLPGNPVLLIGTDCPVLAASHLVACAEALAAGADAVFLPAEDGGYALVGLRRLEPALFFDMPWGTAGVMPETRRRAATLGLVVSEPAFVWDIDRPADYERALSLGLLPRPTEPPPTTA